MGAVDVVYPRGGTSLKRRCTRVILVWLIVEFFLSSAQPRGIQRVRPAR